MARLRLVPISGNPIDVTQSPSLVGRDPGCEIVVTDGSASRRHARLESREGTWWVVDQASANGTYVNSLKVGETALRNGQELRFGALAFRVDIMEDPEATVSSPILPEQTVLAAPVPSPPAHPPAPPPPIPAAPPPPPPRSAVPPPPAPGRGRRAAGGAPVAQIPAGAAPAKKGRGPFFWIGAGCCGCLLLVVLFTGILGGGVWFMTRGAAEAAQARLQQLRDGEITAVWQNGLSTAYKATLDPQGLEDLVARHPGLREYRDATFWRRSVDDKRAVLAGVLTSASGPPEAVTIRLVKEGGEWKIDEIRFETDER